MMIPQSNNHQPSIELLIQKLKKLELKRMQRDEQQSSRGTLNNESLTDPVSPAKVDILT